MPNSKIICQNFIMCLFFFYAIEPESVIRLLALFCSIVEQMCRCFIEGVAGYVEMKWQRRCRQAEENSKEAWR